MLADYGRKDLWKCVCVRACVHACDNAMNAMQDNAAWDLQMDEQIMSWAIQRPEDWQLGGRWEAFVWGGGRIGQLGEAGRNVLTPTPAQSFTCAQQVSIIIYYIF